MAWIYLLLAGLAEIGMTTAMRYIDGSLKLLPVAVFLLFANISFGLLIVASWTIPLGTAYAVWTGIGAAGTVVVGLLWFAEPATTLRLTLLTLLVGATIGLKLVS